jgi:hypothetical protein
MSNSFSGRRERDAPRGGLHRFFLIVRLTLAAFSLSLLPACSTLPTSIVPEHASFDGMNALVSNGIPARPLHILAVHGMGTTTPDQFEGFILALANRLRLVQILQPHGEPTRAQCGEAVTAPSTLIRPLPTAITITGVPPKAWAQLYTYNFASVTDDSCRPVLTVSFLLWAPLTKDVKKNALAESKAPAPQEFAEATKGFIRDYLGDVVLYGGTFRDNVMRPSLQAALCRVTGAKPSPDGKWCTPGPYNDPTIIITHSLGGYMLIDTMDNELRSKNCNQTASGKILANTDYIFMMANQVALLDLTTLRNYPRKLGGSPLENERAQRFAKCWTPPELNSAALLPPTGDQPVLVRPTGDEQAPPEAPKKQVVAFNDPNDILSWEVDPKNLGFPRSDWPQVKLTNVYLPNGEFSVPRLFSDPITAHNGYLDNQTVMELLVCGMSNGAVNTCLPNGLH